MSLSAAFFRWLTAFFSLISISAKVRLVPLGRKTGSYPNPFLPTLSSVIVPSHIPSKRCSFPFQIREITVLNLADLSDIPSNFSSNLSMFFSNDFSSPAYLALKTPGSLFNDATSSPVSSLKQSRPRESFYCR